MKRRALTIDGVEYPISSVARFLSAHDPLTGATVARGTTRGALVAQIRRDLDPGSGIVCGQPCVEDAETLDRVIPRSSDQHDQPSTPDGATDKNGYVESTPWIYATGALFGAALGIVVGATWNGGAATVACCLCIAVGTFLACWEWR